MTVLTAYEPLLYSGNGATQSFDVTWPFFTGSLVVTRIVSGVETELTINVDYTVTGGTDGEGKPGLGSVIFGTAPASGTQIRIERDTPLTQGSTWDESDNFPQAVVESGLDKSILIAQEIAGKDWSGPKGDQGDVGPANTLSKGTVSTGDAGSEADFSITGDAPSQVLNLTIPRGDKGVQGDPGLKPVQVDELSDRDAYDDEDEGFSVLVSDTGDGRAAIYSKNSSASADWSGPAYVTGASSGGDFKSDGSVQMTGPIVFTEADAPSTPASGTVALYAKDDSKLYTKNDEGVETEVGAGGSSIAVNGDTDADEIVLWDAEDGASVKSGGAPVAFLRANGALTDYAVNMLHDGGRFIEKDGNHIAGTYTFNSSVWGLVNDASQASVAKFIFNNTDYGGNGGSLNANVKALIDTIRDPNVRRYGVEFWVAEITAGSGTSAPIVIGEDSTYLCFRQDLIAVPPAATLHCYLRAITNRIWLRQYPNQVIYKWGEPFPSHVSIDPGEGWVSIMVHQNLDPYSQWTYGNPSMLTVQRINSGDKFQFACPALMGGITNVNPNIGLVASASKYMP